MVSGIRFFSSSGALGCTVASLYAAGKAEPGTEIFNFETGATNSPNRVGFFGAQGAPNSPIVVSSYQDRTHRTDHFGTDRGQIVNIKFTGASTADVSGVPMTGGLQTIPNFSGTLLARFAEPNGTAVTTQNATLRAVGMTSVSGVPVLTTGPTNLTVQAFQLADTQGFAGNTVWTDISDPSVTTLSLQDQSSSNKIHDWHLCLSTQPTAAGVNRLWGLVLRSEFLSWLIIPLILFYKYW